MNNEDIQYKIKIFVDDLNEIFEQFDSVFYMNKGPVVTNYRIFLMYKIVGEIDISKLVQLAKEKDIYLDKKGKKIIFDRAHTEKLFLEYGWHHDEICIYPSEF
jgi:hypothetical protein